MAHVVPGDILAGKYRVTKVIGVGGMGVVVAAQHIQLDEPVALKFMLPDALSSPEAVARFHREARASVKLRSEHVARVSDVGTLETGAPYIVMEYLEGTDLAGLLAAQGPLRTEVAVEFVLQACDAVAEAHAMGVVHRDLKPANLFLTHRKDGTPLVKVLDFGISKSSALNEQGAGALTKTGGIMGSPLYMSPEQMKSAKDTDARTDVWALGVILYELLGGRPPFDSDTIGGLMALVLTEPPPELASLRGGLPPGLSQVVSGCLQKDRNLRWQSIAHLASALAPFAPPRAQGLVERISIVLGQGAAPMHPPAARVPSAPAHAASMTGAGGVGRTSPGWGTTAAPTKSGKGVLLVVVGVVGIFAIVGGIVAVRSSASHAVPSATASAAPSAPSEPAPAATAAAAPPPTATAAPAAPPPTAESAAAPPAAPEIPAVATSATHPTKAPMPKKGTPATPLASAAPVPAKSPPARGLFDTSN